jgi:hypothetical protein
MECRLEGMRKGKGGEIRFRMLELRLAMWFERRVKVEMGSGRTDDGRTRMTAWRSKRSVGGTLFDSENPPEMPFVYTPNVFCLALRYHRY